MNRTERFYKIERMLRNREVVPIRDFLVEVVAPAPLRDSLREHLELTLARHYNP